MPMKWEKDDLTDLWRWKKGDNTAVIHRNSTTRAYDVSVIRSVWSSGMGLTATGFGSVEDAQRWAALLLRED